MPGGLSRRPSGVAIEPGAPGLRYTCRAMSILKVARMGHPALRTRARALDPTEVRTAPFQKLVDDMIETMEEYAGIGLAGPQVHEGLRLFVAAIEQDNRKLVVVPFINPEVTPVGDVCGEVYRQSPALLDMSFPPLAWQTYDIDFVAARYNGAGTKTANARATVRLNGVVVHDQRELTGPTGQTNHGDAESPEPGPLVLQDHETPVFYRNIWIVEPPG